jgi:peptidoglycan/xylan/chitin deacetylase (PgdA/CDA1 family)
MVLSSIAVTTNAAAAATSTSSTFTLETTDNVVSADQPAAAADTLEISASPAVVSSIAAAVSQSDTVATFIPAILSRGDPAGRRVAITIDDAWNAEMVKKALDTATSRGVKLTFFPVGAVLSSEKDLWRRAVSEGHEIGNHTFDHPSLTRLSNDRIVQEIQASQEALDGALGYHYPLHLLRPPYGNGGYNDGDKRILDLALSLGYAIVMWSVDPLRASSKYDHVVNNTHSGDIVLLHFNAPDINDLGRIIDTLRARGYILTTVDGLFRAGQDLPQSAPPQDTTQEVLIPD